jgi:hypothetical protein
VVVSNTSGSSTSAFMTSTVGVLVMGIAFTMSPQT